jgi:hypothetical protein
MTTDQLTRNERIRLEALSQSVNATSITSESRPSLAKILDNAKVIEKFLKEADLDRQ